MADAATKADPAKAEAEHRARVNKDALTAQMQAEEDAMRAKAAASLAPAVETPKQPKLGMKLRDTIKRCEERFLDWSVLVTGCTAAEALADPTLLWPVHDKVAPRGERFHVVLLHDPLFAWEVSARVMKIDPELHHVYLSPLGPVIEHRISVSEKDYSGIEAKHLGVNRKWALVYSETKTVMKDGFESEAEANKFLAARKLLAA